MPAISEKSELAKENNTQIIDGGIVDYYHLYREMECSGSE